MCILKTGGGVMPPPGWLVADILMALSPVRMIVAGLVGALIAAVVTVIALNLVAGEKQVQRKLEHRYAIDDAQFRRELGTLLGPPIIDGNRSARPI